MEILIMDIILSYQMIINYFVANQIMKVLYFMKKKIKFKALKIKIFNIKI